MDQKVRDLNSESGSACTDKIENKDCIVVWEYYGNLCWGMIWNPGTCAVVGLRTEGVGGVLAILLKWKQTGFKNLKPRYKLYIISCLLYPPEKY